MSNWWSKASTAQKLAQLRGGIECELTSRQIALASGLHPDSSNLVRLFASHHGVKFATVNRSARHTGVSRRGDVGRDRRSFLSGDRVDLWGNTEPQDEFALDEREAS